MSFHGHEAGVPRTVVEPQPNHLLNFLAGNAFPWPAIAVLIALFLAAGLLDISGRTTSLIIGIVGMASIVARAGYGWWALIRSQVGKQPIAMNHETRLWTGFRSTFLRWLSNLAGIIGYVVLIAVIAIALSGGS